MFAPEMIDGAAEEALDVILERQVSVRTVRVAPVDDVDILAAREQALDDGTVGLQVDHVRAIDQCVTDQQRHASRWSRIAAIAIQHDLAIAPDFLACGCAVIDVLDLAQRAKPRAELGLQLHGFAREGFGVEIERTVHRRVPFAVPAAFFAGDAFVDAGFAEVFVALPAPASVPGLDAAAFGLSPCEPCN